MFRSSSLAVLAATMLTGCFQSNSSDKTDQSEADYTVNFDQDNPNHQNLLYSTDDELAKKTGFSLNLTKDDKLKPSTQLPHPFRWSTPEITIVRSSKINNEQSCDNPDINFVIKKASFGFSHALNPSDEMIQDDHGNPVGKSYSINFFIASAVKYEFFCHVGIEGNEFADNKLVKIKSDCQQFSDDMLACLSKKFEPKKKEP